MTNSTVVGKNCNNNAWIHGMASVTLTSITYIATQVTWGKLFSVVFMQLSLGFLCSGLIGGILVYRHNNWLGVFYNSVIEVF